MDAMYSAIKSRRGGLLNDQEENAHQVGQESPQQENGDMQGLVASLSPEQKNELLSMLVQEQSPQEGDVDPVAIQEGAMGPGEQMELDQEMDQGDGEGHESEDQIMESMISSADSSRVDQGVKPRNLGERVKMNMAQKLKEKKKG